MEYAAGGLGPDSGIDGDLINRHAWLADAYFTADEYRQAKAERVAEERLLSAKRSADPRNMHLLADWVALQIAMARLDQVSNLPGRASKRLSETLPQLASMVAYDPANKDWKDQQSWVRKQLSLPEAVKPRN